MNLSGKECAEEIHQELCSKIDPLDPPSLSVVLVGDDPASTTYVRMKTKACQKVGIRSQLIHLAKNTSQEHLLATIDSLNHDPQVDGILVQIPLPEQIDEKKVMVAIDPLKDVDGFHPINMGKLLLGDEEGMVPCTPLGIYELLKRAEIDISGQHVVILGRSHIVGKPLAALLMQKRPFCNASVTVLHSRSQNLKEITQSADILIAAIGSPRFVKKEMVKTGAIVIDVGINRVDDHSDKGYHLEGDVDYDNVKEIASAITKVPGGVGPMTVAMLLANTVKSASRRLF